MNEQPRILVVDDEPQITRMLRRGLTMHGYLVRVAAEGEAALETYGDWHPELVITDLSMPHMDGLELCRRLRSISQAPIIVLSVKGEEHIKIEALDAGADDYITKPFSIGELLARVRAALRRAPTTVGEDETVITTGDFQVDIARRSVTVRGQEVRLSPKEFDLLAHFLRHPSAVLTHRALLAAVWGGDYVGQTEYLRVFVNRLRKKIEPEAEAPRYIRTEPWIGYRFESGA
jgi:two-component system, OmpR family, KDP operon response regulator KdpE